MKIINFFILVLTVSVSTISCSKDTNDSSVLGDKYESNYAKITTTTDGNESIIEIKTIAELKEYELYMKIEFKSDNTFWYLEIDKWVEAGTWTQTDSKITVTVDADEGDIDKIYFIKDGDNLTLIFDEYEESGKLELYLIKV